MNDYDREAEATGWFGPEIVFGLMYSFVEPGQRLLDIGIGTGLSSALFQKAGLDVTGIDLAPEMLEVCRGKGFTRLVRHDLRVTPYPLETGSMDHAVCMGVMNFFRDPDPIFREAGRIVRSGGLFGFVVGEREEGETTELLVGSEHTHSDEPVVMYRHSSSQVAAWVGRNGFSLTRDIRFNFFMDIEKKKSLPVRAYLVKRMDKDGQN